MPQCEPGSFLLVFELCSMLNKGGACHRFRPGPTLSFLPRCLTVMTRNSPPVHKLSEDVVLHIFMLCGPSAFAYELMQTSETQWTEESHHCLAITHVCRVWRIYALRYPPLWSTPLMDRPKLAQVMLQRAGGAPLTIYRPTRLRSVPVILNSDIEEDTPQALREALAQYPRISELAMIVSPLNFVQYLSVLSFPAESLEIFSLELMSPNPIPVLSHDVSEILNAASSLRRAFFRSCLPHFDALFLRRLTHLSLHCHSGEDTFWNQHTIKINEILKVLSNTLCLQQLSVCCMIDYSCISSSLSPPVHLPEIISIHITDRPVAVAVVMSCICAPRCTNFTLMACLVHDKRDGPRWEEHSSDGNTADALKTLQPAMSNSLSCLRLSPRIIFGVDLVEYQYSLRIDGYGGRSREGTIMPGPASRLIFGHVSRSPLLALYMAIDALNLHNTVELVLSIQPLWTPVAEPGNMEVVFSCMPELRYLTLYKSPILLQAVLSALRHVPKSSPYHAAVCPTLETIRILYSNVWQAESTSLFEVMVTSLEARAHADTIILKLVEIDEHASALQLSGHETSQRVDRLLGFASQVIVPPPRSESQ